MKYYTNDEMKVARANCSCRYCKHMRRDQPVSQPKWFGMLMVAPLYAIALTVGYCNCPFVKNEPVWNPKLRLWQQEAGDE